MNFQDLENARETYVKKLKKFFIPAIVFFAISLIVAIISAFSGGVVIMSSSAFMIIPGLFIVTIIAMIIATFCTRNEAKTYKHLYKTYFVEQSLKQHFTEVQYNHEAGMPKTEIQSTGMMRMGSIYSSNDLFSGKYHDVSLKQADVHIQEEYTDSDGNTQYVTIFRGRWMIFEFPKPFTFRLQVVQKRFGAAKKASKNEKTGRKLKRISTESITFDEKFKIYAEDDFEAYYLLDPAFIDHIEKLSEQHEGKLMLCFIDNKLHVAFYNNKDAFETPNPLKKLDEATESAKINQEIKVITDYVDFLKLDHKLFEKPKS